MKIPNLFPIRYILFLPALLCFVMFATCSSGKKEAVKDTVAEKKPEKKVTQPEQPGVQKSHTVLSGCLRSCF